MRKPIKLAFIGTGLRTFTFLKALKDNPDCELVALCDLYPARMRHVAQGYGLEHVPRFTDLRECLARSGCDAVMVFTPDGNHAEVAVPALNAGKHVFLEKPLEITEEACQSIIEADESVGGRSYVGFNLRHAPVYRKIKQLIDDGVAGDLLTIQADEFYDGGRTYFRRWNRLRKFGGGLWITKACHDFDILQWLAGRPPRSVTARAELSYYRPKPEAALYCADCELREDCPDEFDRYVHLDPEVVAFQKSAVAEGFPRPDLCLYNSDKDTFDHGTAQVAFEGGLLATYTVNVVSGFTNRRIRVSGTKAAIDGDLTTQEVCIRHRDPSREERLTVSDSSDGHGGADKFVLPDFLAFVRGEKTAPVTPRKAFLPVRMGLAARASSDTGGSPMKLG